MFDWFFKKGVARHPETGFPIINKETRKPNIKAFAVTAALGTVALVTIWRNNGKEKRRHQA
jgi:hypothetical protein